MTMLEERVSSIEGAYEHLATKADVQELRGDMNAAIEGLRGEMNTSAQELRGDMNTANERLRGDMNAAIEKVRADLISEIRASEIRMIKWVAGLMVGTALGIVTAMAALLRLFLQ